MNALETLRDTILTEIEGAEAEAALESVRVASLGKKGSISALLKTLGGMSPEERQLAGPKINGLKAEVDQAIRTRKDALKKAALDLRLAEEWTDITLPLADAGPSLGRIHPISQVWDEVTVIFGEMGFSVAEGPDIETDDYNFTKLNFPVGHPARETQDTFFMPDNEAGEKMLLRTHTSPVQIRTMLQNKPPIRVICPGRTYRCDDDQTHTPMFHQVEGLLIDKQSHMGHLKWVLAEFCKRFFEIDDVTLRFRPSYFPFTEPSMEVDVGCDRSGAQVKIGEGEDWLEILGCGMVNPRVLENCGLDPKLYQGFAWGIGIDRLAMLKYGMPDLRAFFDSDLRWLRHYGFSALDLPSAARGGGS